jgi:hypothetical protein
MSLRERKKRLVQATIEEAALRLFVVIYMNAVRVVLNVWFEQEMQGRSLVISHQKQTFQEIATKCYDIVTPN